MSEDNMTRRSLSSKPHGPFTRWWEYDVGWQFEDYDTLQEAIESHDSRGPLVITRPVKWEVKELPANAADYIEARRSECTTALREAGKPYPRTCAVCGLGPCRYERAA